MIAEWSDGDLEFKTEICHIKLVSRNYQEAVRSVQVRNITVLNPQVTWLLLMLQ